MATQQEIHARALQLGGPGSVPPLATATDGDIFNLPVYTEDFSAGYWEAFSGKVSLRFPSFGDEVEIERLAVMRGGTLLARAQAAILICLCAAPAVWWRSNPNIGGDPVPTIDKFPCSVEIVGLFSRWLLWRDSFCLKPAEPPSNTSV